MGSEGEQRWVSRAVQGSLPSQHRSLWMAPVLPGECCTLFHSPHSPLWEHPGHIPGVLLPRCPLPPILTPCQSPWSRAQPCSALTAPDKPGWLCSASPSASTWIFLSSSCSLPHGKGPHKESRWPPCSSQVGSPVSCSLEVSLFLQPIRRDVTPQLHLHLLGCSSACGSTDIPRAGVLPAAGKPLLTPGLFLAPHSGLKGNFSVFSCSPQDAVGAGEPSASLGPSALMEFPEDFWPWQVLPPSPPPISRFSSTSPASP